MVIVVFTDSHYWLRGSTLVKLMPGVSPEAMTLCGLCNGTGATTKRQMMITEGNLWFQAGVI